LDGDLSHWESDREKLTRVGTLEVDLEVIPGISSRHRGDLGTNESTGRIGEEIERLERDKGRRNIGIPPQHENDAPKTSDGSHQSHPATEPSPATTNPYSNVATAEHGARPGSTLSSAPDTNLDSTAATAGHGAPRWRESQSVVGSPSVLSQTSLARMQSDASSAHPGTQGTLSTNASMRATDGHGHLPFARPTIPECVSSMDGTTGHGNIEEENSGNTIVPPEETDVQQVDRSISGDSDDWVRAERDEEVEEDAGSQDVDDEGHSKNPIKKIKAWKQNQRDLGAEHRGVMQAKPARTAVWRKDKVEDKVHSVKDRFSMEARQPNVETEA